MDSGTTVWFRRGAEATRRRGFLQRRPIAAGGNGARVEEGAEWRPWQLGRIASQSFTTACSTSCLPTNSGDHFIVQPLGVVVGQPIPGGLQSGPRVSDSDDVTVSACDLELTNSDGQTLVLAYKFNLGFWLLCCITLN